MDWRPNRRRSRKYPPNFSYLLRENVCNETASFIAQFDRNEPRMRQIVDELQMIAAKIKDIQKMSERARGAGAAAAGAHTAPFTGGSSLAVAASAGFHGGVTTAFGFTTKQKTTDEQNAEKVEKLTGEFRTVVVSLNSELETVKTACGELRRESARDETLNLIQLELKILELVTVTAKLRISVSVQCITEVSDEYGQTVNEFKKLKTELRHFIESK